MSESLSVIFGIAGTRLTADERAFFAKHRPYGYILFARNIGSADEVKVLTSELRDLHDDPHLPIFIDQEGGRVQRIRAPMAPDYPAARVIGDLYDANHAAGLRAAWLLGRLHAFDLMRLGINANCLPCLDVPVAGAHDIIGHPAYSLDPKAVSVLGRQTAEGSMAGGVLPVMKHIPGHGRALVDSHKSLPVVSASADELADRDFTPFAAQSDLPAAMTAHVVYEAIDPDAPGTFSSRVIGDVIRGQIGFDGLLMSDDVSMHALSGDFAERARRILTAGCDIVLHCNGDMGEMSALLRGLKPMGAVARSRALQARIQIETAAEKGLGTNNEAELRAEFERLSGLAV